MKSKEHSLPFLSKRWEAFHGVNVCVAKGVQCSVELLFCYVSNEAQVVLQLLLPLQHNRPKFSKKAQFPGTARAVREVAQSIVLAMSFQRLAGEAPPYPERVPTPGRVTYGIWP